MKKYKNKNDFAEKVINNIPFVQNMNISVSVGEHSVGYKPLKGKFFNGGQEITMSFMDKLGGIIDGLRYGYEQLTKQKILGEKISDKY